MATDTQSVSANVTPRLGRKGEEQRRLDSKSIQPLRRLVPFILRYKWRVVLTMAFLVVAAVATLVMPFIAGRIVDKGFVEQNLGEIAQYGWLIIGIAAIMAVASGSRFYAVSILGERVLTDQRGGELHRRVGGEGLHEDDDEVGRRQPGRIRRRRNPHPPLAVVAADDDAGAIQAVDERLVDVDHQRVATGRC